MHRPLFVIGIAFILGICLQKFFCLPFLLIFTAAILVIISSLVFSRQKQSGFLILAAYFLLGSIFYANSATVAADHISKLSLIKNQNIFLKGVVISEPKNKGAGKIKKSSFILEAQEIKLAGNWHRISGKLLVNSYKDTDFSYADYVVLEGGLFKPANFYLGAKLTYADYLKMQGINFVFFVKKVNLAQILSQNRANFFILASLKAKKIIQDKIRKNLPSIEAGILEAIILGERSALSKEVNNLFIQTGTAHILAISGFNVGIVAFIILIFLKALRIEKRLRILLVIIFIIIYAVITGSQPSVVRASIMAIVFLTGILKGREIDIYNSLGLSAMIILMFSPQTLFNAGFQLSFLSVIFIVWLGPIIEKSLLKFSRSNSRILIWIVRSISISLAAWIGVLGLIAYYFNILTPVTVLANLFIVPLVSIAIALGFCLVAAGTVFAPIAFLFSASTKLCLDLLVYGAYLFSKLPLAFFYLKPLTLYQVLGYYLTIFILLKAFPRPNHTQP